MRKTVIGLDIGGANIKAVKVVQLKDSVSVEDVVREYMPLWVKGVDGLRSKLKEIKQRFNVKSGDYAVGVCMTAELSDVFSSKSEGVYEVVDVVEDIYSDASQRLYVDVYMNLIDANEVRMKPLAVAGANWVASAWLLERISEKLGIDNMIFVDIGSTTTTIIPIVKGKTTVRGRTDPEKLVYGELVYIGTLRTNVTSLVDRVPLKGLYVGICREKFALVGDVHLILGYIRSEDYTTETADGRGKSVEEAVARLARVVCADTSMVSVSEVREIARYIYEVQIFKVFEALMQIRSWLASLGMDPNNFMVIVAGTGKHIAIEALKRAGFSRFMDIDSVLEKTLSPAIPAYAVALMVLNNVIRYVDGS